MSISFELKSAFSYICHMSVSHMGYTCNVFGMTGQRQLTIQNELICVTFLVPLLIGATVR